MPLTVSKESAIHVCHYQEVKSTLAKDSHML